ncbi:hypothetical protein AWW66_07160 [Micromonospora rosaria]|uniref:DUF7660 domain-containing protein n=1 Tax=Micromonospora rosaria TaxID=47874 RepID=A0A136PW23_9ACTN|nr:hypothetical protein [Micromonospora rosaria]KXK62690.1 hypothetical protein AWW66_07160 [Micromonospora rosaria]
MSSGYGTGRFTNIRPDEVNHITMHTDAAEIVRRLLTDLRAHPTEWENHTLERFLAALESSLTALPWLYRNRGEDFPDPPTWKQFTEALIMATGRE